MYYLGLVRATLYATKFLKMKFFYISFFITLLFFVAACTQAPYPKLVTQAQQADSIVVHFFEPGTSKGIKHKSTTLALGLTKIVAYLADGNIGTKNTCPVDGVISFYLKGKPILKTTLQYRETCWQINAELNGKIVYITMPAEGKTFFTALEKDADKNEIILNF